MFKAKIVKNNRPNLGIKKKWIRTVPPEPLSKSAKSNQLDNQPQSSTSPDVSFSILHDQSDNQPQSSTSPDVSFSILHDQSANEYHQRVSSQEIEYKENIDVESQSCELEVVLDFVSTYEIEIIKHRAVIPCDNQLQTFAVPDFDFLKRQLKSSKQLVIKYHTFLVVSASLTLRTCSCDDHWCSFVDSLNKNIETLPDQKYCNHIKATGKYIEYLRSSSSPNISLIEESEVFENEVFETRISFLHYDPSLLLVDMTVTLGIVGLAHDNLICLICDKNNCDHIAAIKDNPDEAAVIEFNSATNNYKTPHKIRCLSHQKIPYNVQGNHQYAEKLKNHSSVTTFCSDIECCKNTKCNKSSMLLLEKEASILISSDNIIEVSVASAFCKNCDTVAHYDGRDDAILHMKGRKSFLVHHKVLRRYMAYFTTGGSLTLIHFYSCWAKEMEEYGYEDFRKEFPYKCFIQSWYSYLDLLDVDFTKGFSCDICGYDPAVIICDGTSLGFQKKFLTYSLPNSESDDHFTPRWSFFQKRVAIGDESIRMTLRKLVNQTMKNCELEQFTNNISKEDKYNNWLLPFLKWICIKYRDTNLSILPMPRGVRDFIRCISSPSAVSSYLPPTLKTALLLDDIFDLNTRPEKMLLFQKTAPIFFNLLKQLSERDKIYFFPMFLHLKDRNMEPYTNSYILSDTLTTNSDQSLSFFPSQPIVRDRGKYQVDKDVQLERDKCTKTYTSFKGLTAGIFTVLCPHGICYGFSCMDNPESCNIPFSIFKTRWSKAPKTLIYDNACNAYAYALNRDPWFFKETNFRVDRMHWKNHKACASSFNADLYEDLIGVNTQLNEQQNAQTKRLARQLSYMTPTNFLAHLKLFLWAKNIEKRNKLTLEKEKCAKMDEGYKVVKRKGRT